MLILFSPIQSTPQYVGRILAFHDAEDKMVFRKRMEWLKSSYTILSLEELIQSKSPKNEIAITFDDGYHCWYNNVFPVLKDLDIPATFFVNSGLLDLEGEKMKAFFKNNCRRTNSELKAISGDELKMMSQHALITIGGHTIDHIDFSKNLDDQEIEKQISLDKRRIESLINRKIHYFAYPFGQLKYAPSNVQEKVEKAGYKAAFTIIPGFLSRQKNPFLFNRDSLEFHQSVTVWDKWLKGAYDPWVIRKLNLYQFFGIRFR